MHGNNTGRVTSEWCASIEATNLPRALPRNNRCVYGYIAHCTQRGCLGEFCEGKFGEKGV